MPRYNPPANWQPPPAGWTPPPGWQPDPAWGPAPEGWPVWVPEAGDGRRPNSDAFLRVGAVALVVFLVLLVVMAIVGTLAPETGGAAFAAVLVPWVISSLIVFFRRSRWSWVACGGLFLGLFLLFAAISQAGRQSGT